MDYTKTFQLYKLDDCTFGLSDSRCAVILDKFGPGFLYSLKNNENIYFTEEYCRAHGYPWVILYVWTRYYRVNQLKKSVSSITVSANQLYRYDYGAVPLEKAKVDDKRKQDLKRKWIEKATINPSYLDNVAFNIYVSESIKALDVRKTQTYLSTEESPIHVSEKEWNSTDKRHKDSLTVTGVLWDTIDTKLFDTVHIHDSYSRRTNYKHKFPDSIHIADKKKTAITKKEKTAFSIVERPSNSSYLNPWEIINCTDHISTYFHWVKTMRESISLADKAVRKMVHTEKEPLHLQETPKKGTRYTRYDSFTVFDDSHRGSGPSPHESIELIDVSPRNDLRIKLNDPMHVLETPTKSLRHSAFKELLHASDGYASYPRPMYKEATVGITDDEKNTFHATCKELIHCTEIYWDNVLFLLHVTENIAISDTIKKHAQKHFYDTLQLLDALRNHAGLNEIVPICFIEVNGKKLNKRFEEDADVSDSFGKLTKRGYYESFGISDYENKSMKPAYKEPIHILEKLPRSLDARYSGDIAITDEAINHLRKDFVETISALEWYASHYKPRYDEKTSIVDNGTKTFQSIYKELLHCTEIYWDNILFLLHVTENVNISERVRKRIKYQLYDTMLVLEKFLNHPALYKYSTFSLTDDDWRQFNKRPNEPVTVDESNPRDLSAIRRDKFSIAELDARNIGKGTQEYFNIDEILPRKSVNSVQNEPINIAELLLKQLKVSFAESVKTIDKLLKHVQIEYGDSFGLTDDETNLFHATYNEELHFTEIYWDNVLFLIHVTESANISDEIKKTAEKQLYDVIMLLDFLKQGIRFSGSDVISITDKIRDSVGKTLTDSIYLADEWRNGMRAIFAEQVYALDGISKGMHTYQQENDVLIVDSIQKHEQPLLQDQLAISDAISRSGAIVMQDAIYMADWIIKQAATVQKDKIAIKDFWSRVWKAFRTFTDELRALDKVYRHVYSVRDDRIQVIDDKVAKLLTSLKKDVVKVDETFDRQVYFKRGFDELASIGDYLLKHPGKNAIDDIALYDAFVRASNSYIEAVQLTKAIKDEQGFYDMSDTPPTYDTFKPFHVGDYEYQKAMLRLRLISDSTNAQPLIYDVAAHIDIDDTDDRGQIEITDKEAPTKVYYNRHYYNAPEVQVIVRGGNSDLSVVPHILTTDGKDEKGRYFEIELQDTSGNRTTGRISWVSKGW